MNEPALGDLAPRGARHERLSVPVEQAIDDFMAKFAHGDPLVQHLIKRCLCAQTAQGPFNPDIDVEGHVRQYIQNTDLVDPNLTPETWKHIAESVVAAEIAAQCDHEGADDYPFDFVDEAVDMAEATRRLQNIQPTFVQRYAEQWNVVANVVYNAGK